MPRLRLVALMLALSLGGPAGAADLWRQDLAAARAEARRSGQPLFLYFDAAWCSWCHRYERQTLSDPGVRRVLAERTVPVRIDWDARPDLVNRYGGRGLPFNVLLAPDGRVLRRFTGILAPADLIALLERPGPSPAAEREGDRLRPRSLDAAAFRDFRAAFLDHLGRLYDPALGTLAGRFATGAGLKRPQPRTWLWLETAGLWPRRRQRAAGVDAGRLLDRLDGGFFYYVDPHRPDGHRETAKLLETNAWLTAWLAGEGGLPRLAAQSGWFFLRGTLWDPRGGFWRARIADADYYALPVAERLRATPPPVQRVKLAGANAGAARALLRGADRLGRPELAAAAARTLDFVLEVMRRNGRLYHRLQDGRLDVPGLPADRFRVLAAGAELQDRRPDPDRARRLRQVARQAARWLAERMEGEGAALRPELAGLVAEACGRRDHYPGLPRGCRDWALRRLTLGPETRPDWLIPGLRAWRQRLDRRRVSGR